MAAGAEIVYVPNGSDSTEFFGKKIESQVHQQITDSLSFSKEMKQNKLQALFAPSGLFKMKAPDDCITARCSCGAGE